MNDIDKVNILLINDICYEILEWLEFQEIICTCSLVCKKWNEISRSACKIHIRIETKLMFQNLLFTLEKFNNNLMYYHIHGLTFSFSKAISDKTNLISIEKLMPNLIHLDIYGSDIEDSGVACLCKLKELKILNIGSNKLTSKGRGIEMISKFMKCLTNLDISFNSLGNSGMKQLKLDKLTDLNVSYCDIDATGIQFIRNMTCLIKLNISGNNINCKGALLLSNLKNLQELDIASACLKEEGAKHISRMDNLKFLSISHNQILNGGAKAISSLSKLEILHISNCDIGCEGLQYISKNLKNLTEIDIGGNHFGMDGVIVIASMNNLKVLSIAESCLGLLGVQYLSKMENLTYLNISDNIDDIFIGESINDLQNLTTLLYTNNSLSMDEAITISSLTQLTTLNIESTEISDVHIEILCSSLHHLINLYADTNFITSWGVKLISESMIDLESLYLSGNRIGDEGLTYICSLQHLRILGVCNCEIGDRGVQVLVNCAPKKLRELLIDCNENITSKGCKLIYSIPQLNSIYLENN
ncbi:LRR_RI domain-containing protein [Naegleria gruberi]|uniref:LRR_RI domain-containing protein n=1 Tax=Naegleria gruberi TaxID=5762 RepID=D2VPI1_NAEGR|nr:LRR_RI domain-containing protein [Naegleria gruberi]EFC41127.1 LRR_RI domain-containing protein [Naegleria gruberi]|eukprot:XP_002673871.1 LRR_RI domain-containing protein [Naegleria gruberi strain NEG-M]